MFKIDIDSDCKINKNQLVTIHEEIIKKTKQSQDVGWDYAFYVIRSENFLEKYKIKKCTTIIELFLTNNCLKVDLVELLIWVNVAKNYVNINIEQKQKIFCIQCSNEIEENIEGEFYCLNCGYIYDTRITGIKDMESINTCKTYYSLNSNLLLAINKFEGKDIYISSKTWERIKNEIKKRQLLMTNLKCDHIVRILKDLKITQHYNDAYFIYCTLSGKKPIIIRKFIPQILKLHNELEYAYKFVKEKDRINSLNVQYKLIKLLQLCEIDDDIFQDFCSLKTEQKLEEHDKKWKEICTITGWKVL